MGRGCHLACEVDSEGEGSSLTRASRGGPFLLIEAGEVSLWLSPAPFSLRGPLCGFSTAIFIELLLL